MAGKFVIKGGQPLAGEVAVRGSKNVATKLMIASLLTPEPCRIKNVPLSQDVEITRELCENIGSQISVNDAREMLIETPEVKNSLVIELSRRNRIPVLAFGPLLHRKGFAEIPVLGGCPIGHRPVNFHIEALNKMGARIERRENSYYAEAPELHGAEIEFPFPSVGATENVLLAGVLAKGKTTIKNAATEPEIMNLIEMLGLMGAKIKSSPESREIEIEGVDKLAGVEISCLPDRNEIVSLAVAALATAGDVLIKNIAADYLKSFLEKVNAIGGAYEVTPQGIRFRGQKKYRALAIETSPHPGFMTDWQQPFCVLLTKADGESIIHETVFEDRFGYTKDFNRMGAKIELSDECLGFNQCRFAGQTFNHSAKIFGPTKLKGAEIMMTDVRAGMAHIIAALAADGESTISGVEHADRGYEKIEERLKALGADIERKV